MYHRVCTFWRKTTHFGHFKTLRDSKSAMRILRGNSHMAVLARFGLGGVLLLGRFWPPE